MCAIHSMEVIFIVFKLFLISSVLCVNDVVPLIEHNDKVATTHLTKPGCWFGRSFYRLEQTWRPVLYPLGQMVCVLCTCQPVTINKVLLLEGHVQCRNVKSACPETKCAKARVLPGECCASCPVAATAESALSLRHLGTVRNSVEARRIDEGKNTQKEYVSLLVGKSDQTKVKTKAVGSGRFTLTSHHLSYSIKLSRLDSPLTVQFREEQGTLLHEREITGQNTHVICGTWSSLPTIYMNSLLEGRLYVVITTTQYPGGEIGGKVQQHRALHRETLSAVLVPSHKDGSGALVMMYFLADSSLSISLIHSGIMQQKTSSFISLAFIKKRKKVKQFHVNINAQESETEEVWRRPRKRDLKSLVRGRLEITVQRLNKHIMKGTVLHQQTCQVLQAILSPSKTDGSNSGRGAGAVALFRLTPRGKLEYSVQFSGNEKGVSKILVKSTNERRKSKALCVISVAALSSNTISGSCGSIKARTLQLLQHRKVRVDVTSRPQLSGSIQPMIYEEDSFTHGVHVLLTSAGVHTSSSLVGHAWLSVSRLCQLNYLIALDNKHLQADDIWQPSLIDITTRSKQVLESVAVNMVMRGVAELSVDILDSLAKGKVKLTVSTARYPNGEIGATVELENNCGDLLRTVNHGNHNLPLEQHKVNRPSEKVSVETVEHCVVNNVKYVTNEVWIPVDDACMTCNCEKGRVTCHPVQCVKPSCDSPVAVPGDCCLQCLDSTFSADSKCFFDGDKRHHHIGTVFHPYVIPFGYHSCAVCSCSTGENDVVCARLPCPQLSCAADRAVRAKPTDCCLTCPDGNNGEFVKEAPSLSSKDIINKRTGCEVQGSTYPPGSVWKPRVGSFGTVPCITCQCVDGKPVCKKQSCPQLDCPEVQQVRNEGACCPQCYEIQPISEQKKSGKQKSKSKRAATSTETSAVRDHILIK